MPRSSLRKNYWRCFWNADKKSYCNRNCTGNVVRITPTEDYPLSYRDTADAAKKEADNEVHPAINDLDVDPTSYKTVFLGYPVWWYRMPMVLETLFDTYDFSGVTIIPFNTHEGSRDGDAMSKTLSQAWASFAREGVPSSDNLPEWESYTMETGAEMILDKESYVSYNHDLELLRLLNPGYDLD